MADIVRLLTAAGALVAVALVAALLEPEWAADLGLRGDGLAFLAGDATEWDDNSSPEETEALVARLAAKRDIAHVLLDGRLTLFEAAALFRRLNREAGGDVLGWPGDTEEERVCRSVIAWATRWASSVAM